MSIEENKLKKFQEICEDMATKADSNLEQEINTKISDEISSKLKSYSEKLNAKLKKQEDNLKKVEASSVNGNVKVALPDGIGLE